MFASGALSYAGPFETTYRKSLIKIWKETLKERDVASSETSTLNTIIGNKVEIASWKAQFKLPDDEFSIENTLIMIHSKRFPLCIDPQNQANNFIKRMSQYN